MRGGDATRAGVTSPEQVLGIMGAGFEQRAVGCHDVNAHSSRSHCALVVHAEATDTATGVRSCGKLTLVDLAGSERIQKTGASGAPSGGVLCTAEATHRPFHPWILRQQMELP